MVSFPMKVSFVLAVSKSLKNNTSCASLWPHVLFHSAQAQPCFPRVGKVHGVNDLLVQNNLVVSPPFQPPAHRRFHAAEKFSSTAKIILQNGAVKNPSAPPLHHILRVCPRLPNQCAWCVKNSSDHHPLFSFNRVFVISGPPLSSFDSQPHPTCRNLSQNRR